MASIQAILEYKAKGLSQSAIANALGTSVGVVAGKLWRHKHNAPRVEQVSKPIIQFVPAPEKVKELDEWEGVDAKPQLGEFNDALARLVHDKPTVVVEHDPDTHIPYHYPPALALRSKCRQMLQPDLSVVGSDAFDFPTISRFEPDPRIPTGRVLTRVRPYWWNHIEQMDYDAPKSLKVWIDGNHDARAWEDIEKDKNYDVLMAYHVETIKASGAVYWLGSGQASLAVNVGNALIVTHGTKANTHTAAAILDEFDRQYSVMAGHSHRPDYFTRGTKYKVTATISGCACVLNPPYNRRSVFSHWQHGYQYGVVDTKSETAVLNLVDFHHDKDSIWCYLNGEKLSVKKQEFEAGQAAA